MSNCHGKITSVAVRSRLFPDQLLQQLNAYKYWPALAGCKSPNPTAVESLTGTAGVDRHHFLLELRSMCIELPDIASFAPSRCSADVARLLRSSNVHVLCICIR